MRIHLGLILFSLLAALTATGQASPVATLSATSLIYSTRLINTTSGSKTVRLTNTGSGALSISQIKVTGQFAISAKTCGTSLAAGSSCTVSVVFRPTTIGTLSGSLTFADNASGSPQTVSLTGKATEISVAPTKLSFTANAGVTSASQSVIVTNHGSTAVTFSGFTFSNSPYSLSSNSCGSSLIAGGSCNVGIVFHPPTTGTFTANFYVSDNGGASPQVVKLYGTGTAITAGIESIHHIIFMAQENRSFDHYYGKLNDYRIAHGLPADVDGLPSNASNPSADGSSTIAAFHLTTQCVENPSPSWQESHVDVNKDSPMSTSSYPMDGFVFTAAGDAQANGFHDTQGLRAMGYYTDRELPYYYFMVSQFATSDRWFSPVMSRTHPNRMYLMAGTSQGHAFPIPPGGPRLTAKTIFEAMQDAGITWKIYVTDQIPGETLEQSSYIDMFTYGTQHPENIVPISQYFTDVANGTLPEVAMIEGGYNTGRDEHPTTQPTVPGSQIQQGATYVSTIINTLMQSSSWKDSVFIETQDEAGGFYDHVPPQPAHSPDGIPPQDLQPTDFHDDFTRTGFRVPLIVVSPFTKKHYVSHTTMDYTAILKLIETRFNLPNLTARDAAQPDMTEFFDFQNVPWAVPPVPPAQPTNAPCYVDHLP